MTQRRFSWLAQVSGTDGRAIGFLLAALAGPIALAVLAQSAAVAAPLDTGVGPEWTLTHGTGEKAMHYRIPADLPRIASQPTDEGRALLSEAGRVEANRKVVRLVANSFNPAPSMRLIPDYVRTATEVAVSIPYADLHASSPLARVVPILRALPTYARIHVVFPPPMAERVRREIAGEGMIGRAVMHPLDDWNRSKHRVSKYSRSTRWIRDTFLIGADGVGKAVAFVPLAYAQVSDLTDSDLDFVHEKWFDPRRVIRFPAFLRGGNVAVADNSERYRVAFVGSREVAVNHDVFRFAAAADPPEALVPEVLRRIAATDRVRVLPNSEHLFHIDMAVSFPAPGIAAVIEPVDRASVDPVDLAALDALRRDVEAAGFLVVSVPTTAERINAFQSPVNAFVFLNKDTGRREAIVSRFQDRRVLIGDKRVSLNDAIRRAYDAAGIRVRWVRDRLSDRHGNVHCAILALH